MTSQEEDIDFVATGTSAENNPAGKQQGGPPAPGGPGRGRRVLNGIGRGFRMALAVVAGVFAFVVTLGAIGLRKIGGFVQKFKKPKQQQTATRKNMGLRHAFCGAAILAGALAGPGVYYMTQPNEIVTTRVTGKVEADTDKEYPGRKFVLYTKGEGKLDTYGLSGGAEIRPGCTYEFNLKGARLEYWPPGYTRSIQGIKHVPTPGCPGN